MTDMVNHPPHYTSHPSGIETIQLTENLDFCIGNAVKYIARYKHKNNPVEDLKKALFYLNRARERHTDLTIMRNAVTDKTVLWVNRESEDGIKAIVGSACLYQAEGHISDLDTAIQHLMTLIDLETYFDGGSIDD